MKKIIATIIAYFIYKTNHVLQMLADLFVSERLDQLSIRYSAWYNKYLISAVISYSELKRGKLQSVEVMRIETMDNLLIAEIEYKGLTLVNLQTYLASSLSIISGIKPDTIHLTLLSTGLVKIIFPMVS